MLEDIGQNKEEFESEQIKSEAVDIQHPSSNKRIKRIKDDEILDFKIALGQELDVSDFLKLL